MSLRHLAQQLNTRSNFDRQCLAFIERIMHFKNVAQIIICRHPHLRKYFTNFMCHVLRLQSSILRRFMMNQRIASTSDKIRKLKSGSICFTFILKHLEQILTPINFDEPTPEEETLRQLRGLF